jgi:hypothetical protein
MFRVPFKMMEVQTTDAVIGEGVHIINTVVLDYKSAFIPLPASHMITVSRIKIRCDLT